MGVNIKNDTAELHFEDNANVTVPAELLVQPLGDQQTGTMTDNRLISVLITHKGSEVVKAKLQSRTLPMTKYCTLFL